MVSKRQGRGDPPRHGNWKRRAVAAAAAAAVVGGSAMPALAGGSSGGGGGYGSGSGSGPLPNSNVYMYLTDNVSQNPDGTFAFRQGQGQASADFAWNVIQSDFQNAFGATPGSQGLNDTSGNTEQSIRTIMNQALVDAANQGVSSGTCPAATPETSRIVEVYFTYAVGNTDWFISGYDRYLEDFEGTFGSLTGNLQHDGSSDAYRQLVIDGIAAPDAVHNQALTQVQRVDPDGGADGARRFITAVALNMCQPAISEFTPTLSTSADLDLKVGEVATDKVTIGADHWVPGATLSANGTLYGPTKDKITPGQDMTGVPVAAHARIEGITGPGTFDATADAPVKTAGHYTWVWELPDTDHTTGAVKDQAGLPAESPTVRFQPQLTTQVSEAVVDAGEQIPDKVTFSGEGWPQGLPVHGSGTLYGPFEDPIQVTEGGTGSPVLPAGAKPALDTNGKKITATATATGPGTVNAVLDAGTDGKVAASGRYVWVWQTADDHELIEAPWWDGLQSSEMAKVTARPVINSKLAEHSITIDKGGVVTDTVIVQGENPADMWFATEDGKTIDLPLKYEVFGPQMSVGAPGDPIVDNPDTPADETVPVLTGDSTTNPALVLSNWGQVTAELGKLDHSGHYTVVWSLDTARLSDEAKAVIDDDYEDATDGTWAENETVTVRINPEVETVTARYVDQDGNEWKPGATQTTYPWSGNLTDTLTVTLPEGDLWYEVDGAPAQVDVGSQPYGLWDLPQAQRPLTDADPVLADEVTQTITAEGEYPIAVPVTVEKPGYLSFVARTHEGPNATGWTSEVFIPDETVSMRDSLTHWSRVYEQSAAPGASVSDNLEIGGFDRDHGSFPGLDVEDGTGYAPDNTVSTVTMYYAGKDNPSHGGTEIPQSAEAIHTVSIAADNHESIDVGFADQDTAVDANGNPIPDNDDEFVIPKDKPGYYVFVFHNEGDDRVTPFTSAFNDRREMIHVPEIPTGETPSIDIEKATGTADGTTFPKAGVGNMADKDNNVGETDHDTAKTAQGVDGTKETPIAFRVTNNGTDALTKIALADHTTVGATDVEITWPYKVDADGYLLADDGTMLVIEPGETFTFTGTLPPLGDEVMHMNNIRVTATGVVSGLGVSDADPWAAKPSSPSIDVEKTADPTEGEHGNGNNTDADNNLGGADADTPETAIQEGKDGTKIHFALTNNGSVDLTRLTIVDETLTGPAAELNLTDAKHVVAGKPVDISLAINKDGFLEADGKLVTLKPGEQITFTADLPALGEEEVHADDVTVTGQDRDGTLVGDHDPFHVVPKKPSIDIEKTTGTEAPKAGAGNNADKDDNLGDGDHDTAKTAFKPATGKETVIQFAVTNNGPEPITHLHLSDKTTVGDQQVAIKWPYPTTKDGYLIGEDGKEIVLDPGERITFTGTLPVLTGDHADDITVTGVGVTSGVEVGDHDPFHAKGPEPSIDIEKTTGTEAPKAGAGNNADKDDNLGDGDHDTAKTAFKPATGKETVIQFAVTNNGPEPITHLRLSDTTTVGTQQVAIKWTHNANPQGFLIGDDGAELVLKPGERIMFTGTLPVLTGDHADDISVAGVGADSGISVGDHDLFYAAKPGTTGFGGGSSASSVRPARTGVEPVVLIAAIGGVLLVGGASIGYATTRRRRTAQL